MVMRRLKAKDIFSVPTDQGTMLRIVRALFPEGKPRTMFPPTVTKPIPPFEESGLRLAVTRLTNGKAPGLDGIPNEALKINTGARPDRLLELFNKCLSAGVFPKPWKRQELVLIPKGKGGDPKNPSSSRPLGMLDTLGELHDRMVLNRLEKAHEQNGGISPMQFGFQKGRSTLHAIQTMQNMVERVLALEPEPGEFCAIIALDVKNASNSASWECIYRSLVGRVPAFLLAVVSNAL